MRYFRANMSEWTGVDSHVAPIKKGMPGDALCALLLSQRRVRSRILLQMLQLFPVTLYIFILIYFYKTYIEK